MISLLLSAALQLPSGLPEGIHEVLEAQLPAWAAVTGNPAPASESAQERIAVERTEGNEVHLWLVARKIRATVRREEGRAWLTEATWCGAGPDRCEDLWARNDEAWRSDKATANHTGYAVYRDSLVLKPVVWDASAPKLVAGKKVWDKGLCSGGLCFLASDKDSSLATVAARPDASTAWWDASYVLGSALEKDLLHGWSLVLDKGRPVPR